MEHTPKQQVSVYRADGMLRMSTENHCHCEAAGRGALSAKREEVPLGCNLLGSSRMRKSHYIIAYIPIFNGFRCISDRHIVPGDCHGPKGPRNDMVDGGLLRRLYLPDKLQFIFLTV